MNLMRHGAIRLLALVVVAFGLAACDGDDGRDGLPGSAGVDGSPGTDGISCWDLNENGIKDLPDEDTNGDGVVDVLDCRTPTGDFTPAALHKGWFEENDYTGGESCMSCHGDIGDMVLMSGHWNWQGTATNIEGFEAEELGKNQIINNFCVAVPTNEGRCAQCHIGVGYSSNSFDFGDRNNIDCLSCHDQTGTYAKAKTPDGRPAEGVDVKAVAQSVAENGGLPTRKACLFCHQNAGGGDNVKHGDLASTLADTTREYDVHMGTDGGDLSCVACHNIKRDEAGNALDHGIGGMPYHSVDEGSLKTCTDCHGDGANIHAGSSVEPIFGVTAHTNLACQACHIPAIARDISTKVEWYWSDAGEDVDPIPVDPVTGRPTYDKMKGTFVWANDVRPTLLYFDGKWDKALIGLNDTFPDATGPENPAVLAAPTADYTTPGAKIYPFKKMIGNQPADVANNKILVPHLWGTITGDNPFWGAYDWNLALQDGANYTGEPYSGEYFFIDTLMYLSVNHEIAPKEQALGMDATCTDCHGAGGIDFTLLGYDADPLSGGTRP
ncbi:MAG: tetrathionate reductase family octaheme c-type cytochrome [Gammaproteobacteria bacterium]